MSSYKIRAFKDDFDFHHDKLPESLIFKFGDQLQRSRELLKSRNQLEILHAIDLLDWMLLQGEELEITHSLDELKGDTDNIFINRVKALKILKESGQVDISEEENLPNAKWSEFFSVLTLVYISEILYSYEYLLEEGSAIKETDYPQIIEWAIESMDAISSAEQYKYIETLPEIEKLQRTNKAKSGFKARDAKIKPIRDKCICHYNEHYKEKNLSNREAARRIVKDLEIKK